MRRNISTSATRGKISRIITTTTAVCKCYNLSTEEVEDIEVRVNGTVPETKFVKVAINSGCIDSDVYRILKVTDVKTNGILYAMDFETFIANAEIIEENITD